MPGNVFIFHVTNLRVQELGHLIKFVEDYHGLSGLKSAGKSTSGSEHKIWTFDYVTLLFFNCQVNEGA